MRGRWRHLPLLALSCTLAAPAGAETLKDALARAYETNPDLLAARATLRATDEGVPIERAEGLPAISSTGRFSEFVHESGSTPGPGRQFAGQVSLGVPVYSGGGTRNAIRAAKVRVMAGRADLRGAESGIFSQVVAAYMDVIRQEAIVGLSANNVEVLSVNLEATRDRFEIGDLTRTDVAQSEARLALAEGNLRAAEANLVGARENYIALVGEAPGELQPPPPLPGLPGDVGAAVQAALDNNPDLQAATERARAAGYDIKVAGSTRLPRVEFTTSADYSDFMDSLPSTTVTPNSSTAVTAGVRATIPLYQAGLPTALQRRAQANASAALERAVATERDLIAQVRGAFASWHAANAIIVSSQAAVDAAELSLEGVRAENTVGNRSILDILDAQQELLSAQVQLVTARRNAYVAGFSLLAAMGRAEARDLGLEEYGPLYDPMVNYDRAMGTLWDWARDPDPEAQATRTVDIPAQDAEIQGPEFPELLKGVMQQDKEPSVEEILESIKKVIARDNRENAQSERQRRLHTGPANSVEDDEDDDEEVLELGEAGALMDGEHEEIDFDDAAAEPGEESLTTESAATAMRDSLAALAMIAEPSRPPQIVRSGETSLEGLTRELLRPMLAEWLDANLPEIVERLVKKEIARIAGKKG